MSNGAVKWDFWIPFDFEERRFSAAILPTGYTANPCDFYPWGYLKVVSIIIQCPKTQNSSKNTSGERSDGSSGRQSYRL